ncbi:MAG TPA: hypothetical protein VLR45_11630 [Desulfoprunum sp.]|nr:hypothetical protein [Desulfoprunum sp.]
MALSVAENSIIVMGGLDYSIDFMSAVQGGNGRPMKNRVFGIAGQVAPHSNG